MTDSQYVGATFNGGLQAPHYVNGRLLTAEDLRSDQAAMLARLALLGRAVGPGVVEGLEVERGGDAAVIVEQGLGFNQEGQPVRLPANVTLPLVPQAGEATPGDEAGRFQDCKLLAPAGSGAPSAGAYLLTAIPASQLQGLAPIKGAIGSTTPAGCVARWEVEGLSFKAIRLAAFDKEQGGVSANQGFSEQNRRSRLAHWCFGSAALPQLAADPFGFTDRLGGLALLAAADLTPCDLPLAVFHWTGTRIDFVDVWAARRRPVRPAALTALTGLLSDRREADGQARLLQFQAHLADLLANPTLSQPQITAATHFRYLPPAGLVPLRLTRQAFLQPMVRVLGQVVDRFSLPRTNLVDGPAIKQRMQETLPSIASGVLGRTQAGGLDPATFFGALMPERIGLIDRETVDFTLRRTWLDEAVAVPGPARLDLLVVEEQLLRAGLYFLIPSVADTLKLTSAARTQVEQALRTAGAAALATLMQLSPSAVAPAMPGNPPPGPPPAQPYALFVKRLRATTWVDVEESD